MSENLERLGMGWHPDLPDFRDYGIERTEVSKRLMKQNQVDSIKTMLDKTGFTPEVTTPPKLNIPNSMDLKKWFSPIDKPAFDGRMLTENNTGKLMLTGMLGKDSMDAILQKVNK